MKALKIITIVLAIVSLFILSGCEKNSPVSPTDNSGNFEGYFVKPSRFNTFTTVTSDTSSPPGYPQSASVKIRYLQNHNAYNGGNLNFVNGTKLVILWNTLTPPQGTSTGSAVVITGSIDYNLVDNELIFTFGPSGCGFSPHATLWMKYGDLIGIGTPNLYYIDENGNYIEQQPDEINTDEQWMKIYIDHFSRYAVAYSN